MWHHQSSGGNRMIVTGTQCQLMAQYIISDLTEKANESTERFEIEALKLEAERLGLEIDFDSIWEENIKLFAPIIWLTNNLRGE